jgi:small-conductance mechanosensitive channel
MLSLQPDNVVEETVLDWQNALNGLVAKLVEWIEGVILALPNMVLALLVFILFWIFSKLVRGLLDKLLGKTAAPRQIRNLIVRVTGIVVLVIGFFVALGVLELDKTVTSLLAGAGIIGIALGFAFQDLAANFLAGVYLAFARPIRTGDVIETHDHFGTVERVDLRNLIVRTPTGQLVMIPNKEVFENPLVNFSATGKRRIDLEVGVSYGDDLDKVKALAIEACEGVEGRDAGRPVELFYTGFGDSSINMVVRFWVPFRKQTDYLEPMSDAIMRVKKAFDGGGITIPFPIRTLDFGIVGGKELSEALPVGMREGKNVGEEGGGE